MDWRRVAHATEIEVGWDPEEVAFWYVHRYTIAAIWTHVS